MTYEKFRYLTIPNFIYNLLHKAVLHDTTLNSNIEIEKFQYVLVFFVFVICKRKLPES